MPALHWLVCPNDHLQVDVFVRDGVLPPCPECGGPSRVTWAHGQAPNNGIFKPLDLGGGVVATSRDDLNAKIAFLEQKHGRQIVVESNTAQDTRVRTDELRHRAWLKSQRAGGDPLRAELKSAEAAKKAEAEAKASARNEDPKAAGAAAAKSLPTQAAAARGG